MIIWQIGNGMKPNLTQTGMGKEISVSTSLIMVSGELLHIFLVDSILEFLSHHAAVSLGSAPNGRSFLGEILSLIDCCIAPLCVSEMNCWDKMLIIQ